MGIFDSILSGVAGGGAGFLGSILGQFIGSNAQHKQQDDINQILNRQLQDYNLGRGLVFGQGNGTPSLFSALADNATINQNALQQYLYGSPGQSTGAFGNLNDLIGSLYNQNNIFGAYGGYDPYGQNIPGVQDVLAQLQGQTGGLGSQADLARQVFAGGGWTPQSQTSFDNLQSFFGGQNPQQQAMTGMANNIFNSNGQSQNPLFQSIMNAAAQGITGTNPNLDFASRLAQGIASNEGRSTQSDIGEQAAANLFKNGGLTPSLANLLGVGQNVLSQNGLTPTGAQGENAALQTINAGGATPTTTGLQNRGLDLANRESLLPLDLATSMARNEAANAVQNNAEAARRQAIARGGGAGSNVASGLQNQALAEYSDKGAQAEAQAVRDTLDKQQALQLQQAGLGLNMANQGGTLENARFGTASNALSNLEDIASRRFSTGGNFITGANSAATNNASTGLNGLANLLGLDSTRQLQSLGLLPTITNAGTNQAGTYGSLYNASNGQNLDALNLGRGLYNDTLNSILGANNQYNNLIGTQGQYALGAGQLANQGTNDIGNLLNNILNGNFKASQQGLDRTNSIFDQGQQGIKNLAGQQQFAANQQNTANSGLNSLLSTILNWTQGQGNAANITAFQNAHPGQNPWGPIAGAALTGILQAIPGFGGSNGGTNSTYAGNDLGGYYGAGPQRAP